MKTAWIYDNNQTRRESLVQAFAGLNSWSCQGYADIAFDFERTSVRLPEGGVNLILLHLRAPRHTTGNQYSWEFLQQVEAMEQAANICLFAYTGGVEQQKPKQFPDFERWRYFQSVQGSECIGANGLRAFLESWV